MARLILIYGQPGSGKSFSLKNLPADKTVIIDADRKGSLPWRGFKKDFSAERKNFHPVDSLDVINASIKKIAQSKEYAAIKNLVIDGISNALTNEVFFYEDNNKTTNKFEKWEQVAKKFARIITTAKKLRGDLNIIFIGHVEVADSYAPGDVDKFFTPGQMLKKTFKTESHFEYVFYSKTDGENFFFETYPMNSTARSPHECFEKFIPNDLNAAIEMIEKYEEGE